MKRTRFGILLIVLFCFASSTRAQWVQTPGPEGGNFSNIVATPSAVLLSAGVDTFMYRSTDLGLSWNRIAGSYSPQYIGGDTLVNIFDSVFRISTDGALNWSAKPLKGIPYLDDIAVNGNDFFTVIHDSSSDWSTPSGNYWIIYHSTDRGMAWDSISTIPQAISASAFGGDVSCTVQAFGSFLLASNVGISHSSKVYRSTDEGQTWTSVYSGTLGNIIDNGTFLLSYDTSRGGIVTSTDAGESWQSKKTGTALDRLSTSISNTFWDSTAVFVSTYDSGIYRFDGSSWKLVDSTPSIAEFGYRDGVDLALSSTTGVLRSTDHGLTWSDANHGMIATMVYWIATKGTSVVVQTASGPFYSPDEGTTWHRVALARYLTAQGALASDDTTIYISSQDKLFRSSDGGATWNYFASPQPGGRIGNMSANGSLMALTSELVALSNYSDTVFVSVDRGASWRAQSINTQLPKVVKIFGTTIFSWGLDTLYRSTNNGETWQNVVLPGDFVIESLTQVGTTLLADAVNSLVNASSLEICISTDDGAHWSVQSTSAINSLFVPYLYGVNGSVLELGDSTIWISNNLGVSFQPFGTGFTSGITPENIAFSDHYALAGTYSDGIWRRPISDISGGVASVPTIALSLTNEPNPFHSQTTLHYSLPNASFVSIELYDALGRSIRTIYSGVESAGLHVATLDAATLPDGTYFCRIITGSTSATTCIIKSQE